MRISNIVLAALLGTSVAISRHHHHHDRALVFGDDSNAAANKADAAAKLKEEIKDAEAPKPLSEDEAKEKFDGEVKDLEAKAKAKNA